MHPVALPEFSLSAVLFMVGALGIHYSIARYEKDRGERYDSIADSIHARSDFFTTLLALTGIIAGKLGWYWLDAVAAMGIVVIIGLAASGIIYECVATVTEANRLNPQKVREVAESVDDVANAHAIRSHGMANDIHLDLHIQIASSLDAEAVFDIENRVARELKKQFPGVSHVSIRHEPTSLPPDHEDDLFR
jgi:cation diffusion facilitator family transporter